MPETVFIENQDLRDLTDSLRQTQTVFKNENNEWVLLHHKDIVAAAKDDINFSSSVSRFLQVPNGMDGQEHSDYRKIIEKYLSPAAVNSHLEKFQQVASDLLGQQLRAGNAFDAITDLGVVYSVRAQCAWLGWPDKLQDDLMLWIQENWQATRSKDIERTALVANQFDDILKRAFSYALSSVRKTGKTNVTAQLYGDQINGRPLNDDEKISILRNWTAGDLGTISLCIGVLMVFLARMQANDPDFLDHLSDYSDNELDLFIDEVIRLDNPFISSRRVTTSAVNVGGIDISAGEKVRLNWISANRDEKVFAKDKFCPVDHAKHNVIYGVGKHVCPGRLLSTVQFRVFLRALLQNVDGLKISISKNNPPVRAYPPIGGYASAPIFVSEKF